MDACRRYLWITRPGGGGLADARFFTQRGLSPLYAPLTRIIPSSGIRALLDDALQKMPGAAFAFTSPNAVRAVSGCFSREEKRRISAYTAGYVTEAAARYAGFGKVFYVGSGSANMIRYAKSGAIIHCSGVDVRVDIASAMQTRGLLARRVIVYHVEPVHLSQRCYRILQAGQVASVLFCSVKAAGLWKKHVLSYEPVAAKRKPAYDCLSEDIGAACMPRADIHVSDVPYPAVLRAMTARRECKR